MKTVYTTEAFDTWFAGLRDQQAKRHIQVRIDRAEDGNFGDCEPVGEGVSEMRIHYGPGYRVYFAQHGRGIDSAGRWRQIDSRQGHQGSAETGA